MLKHLRTRTPGPPQWFKWLCGTILLHKHACTSCTVLYSASNGFFRTFQTLKEACRSFTGPPQWLNWLCMVFLALKHVCTSITGLSEWFKWLCRTFLMPELVCTSCTAPLQFLKWVCRTFQTLKRLVGGSQDLHSG